MSIHEVVHTTTLTYGEPAKVSMNEARMRPVSNLRQRVHEAKLEISPVTHIHEFLDYWGSAVTMFEVRRPHSSLVLTATSRVETLVNPFSDTPVVSWEELRSVECRDLYAEFLAPTPYTTCSPEFVDFAREFAGNQGVGDAVVSVLAGMRNAMEYVPGVTGVHTSAVESWQEKKGVCQDMAHIGIAMLRSLGIPARYASGYVHPDTDAELGALIAGQSHAWIEWWDGTWRGYDPTNSSPVGEYHVQVGHGRDYADVAPLRGVVAASGTSELSVSVQIRQLA